MEGNIGHSTQVSSDGVDELTCVSVPHICVVVSTANHYFGVIMTPCRSDQVHLKVVLTLTLQCFDQSGVPNHEWAHIPHSDSVVHAVADQIFAAIAESQACDGVGVTFEHIVFSTCHKIV